MVDLRKIDLSKANVDQERSRIRLVNINDPIERKRLWEIETDQLVAKFVEDLSETEEEMVEFTTNEKDYLVLGVEGKTGHVEETEVGKLQGWISIYKDEKRRLARIAKEGIVNLLDGAKRVLEVGFARHPLAKSGQMAGALRQTIKMLSEEHAKDGEHQLVVTAYVDEVNEASVRVLEAAGFKRMARVKYHVKNKSFDHFYLWEI